MPQPAHPSRAAAGDKRPAGAAPHTLHGRPNDSRITYANPCPAPLQPRSSPPFLPLPNTGPALCPQNPPAAPAAPVAWWAPGAAVLQQVPLLLCPQRAGRRPCRRLVPRRRRVQRLRGLIRPRFIVPGSMRGRRAALALVVPPAPALPPRLLKPPNSKPHLLRKPDLDHAREAQAAGRASLMLPLLLPLHLHLIPHVMILVPTAAPAPAPTTTAAPAAAGVAVRELGHGHARYGNCLVKPGHAPLQDLGCAKGWWVEAKVRWALGLSGMGRGAAPRADVGAS
jgi:hypothetical protein